MELNYTFQGEEIVQLECGPARIRVAPQFGARLLSWEIHGHPIISWPKETDWGNVVKVRGGNPILFPFIGRHFADKLIDKWKDSDGTVRPMPMHGFARNESFTLLDNDHPKTEVHMRLTDSARTWDAYPFKFHFDVIYRLGKNTLEVEFITTNLDDRPLPYYAGHHFYFNLPSEERDQWTIELPYARTGRQRPDGVILTEPAREEQACLVSSMLVDRFHIQPSKNTLLMRNRHRKQSIRFDLPAKTAPWYALTTWTPGATADVYCVEPWLGLPNAIHTKQGLRLVDRECKEHAFCKLTAEGF